MELGPNNNLPVFRKKVYPDHIKVMHSNEEIIRSFHLNTLAAYYLLKLKFPNSKIYRYSEELKERTGWSRRTFHNKMSKLLEADLVERNEKGMYILKKIEHLKIEANSGKDRIKHKTKLILEAANVSERTIKDALLLKLFEEKHGQVSYHKHTKRRKLDSPIEQAFYFRHVALVQQREAYIKKLKESGAASTHNVYKLGDMSCKMYEFAEHMQNFKEKAQATEFYEMPIGTVSKHLGVSSSTMKRWKKRAISQGTIKEKTLVFRLPTKVFGHMSSEDMNYVGKTFGCAIYAWKGKYYCRVASMCSLHQRNLSM